MRFVVYGAGAVGGTIGARLFQHGHEVLLIARGEHGATLRKDGLLFETPDESARLQIPCVAHPRDMEPRPDDVVVLSVKSQDTVAALEALRAVAGAGVPIVCAQNGVANERMALRRFDHVYGMVVFLPATHLEPGVVQSQSRGKSGVLDCGRFPDGVDEWLEAFCTALEASRFSARPDAKIMRWKYAKLLRNLANAAQACCGPIAGIRDLALRARAEARRCLEAAGIEAVDDETFRARMRGELEMAAIHGVTRAGGSTWQSVERGAGSVEVDYLNGEIVLLGRLHGIPTPVNAGLRRALLELVQTGAPAASMSPADLEARVNG